MSDGVETWWPVLVPPAATRELEPGRTADEGTGFGEVVRQGTNSASEGRVGSSVRTESPDLIQHSGDKLRGTVRRTEHTEEGGLIHKGSARVSFDMATGELTVPVTVAFEAATAADSAEAYLFPGQTPPTTVDNALIRQTAQTYLNACNGALNGWYGVVLTAPGDRGDRLRAIAKGLDDKQGHTAPGDPHPPTWAGRTLPIKVQVTEVTNGTPDFVVAVSPLKGRSYVQQGSPGRVVLFVGAGQDYWTAAHEGSHMALGTGDEYNEKDSKLIKKNPTQFSRARERPGQWSLMDDQNLFRGWMLMHSRHFAFVPAFLTEALAFAGLPGYDAKLVELARPVSLNVRISFQESYSSMGGGGLAFGGGVGVGLALDRERRWQAFLEARINMLLALPHPLKSAYLLGARSGLEGRTNPSGFGLNYAAFVEAGVAGFDRHDSAPHPSAPYVGAGLSLGIGDLAVFPHVGLQFGAEASVGTRLDTADPQVQRWIQLGITAGMRFW